MVAHAVMDVQNGMPTTQVRTGSRPAARPAVRPDVVSGMVRAGIR
jgi:hypothetical protein